MEVEPLSVGRGETVGSSSVDVRSTRGGIRREAFGTDFFDAGSDQFDQQSWKSDLPYRKHGLWHLPKTVHRNHRQMNLGRSLYLGPLLYPDVRPSAAFERRGREL
jgi:hypothetical protein